MTSPDIRIERSTAPRSDDERAEILANPGFGQNFTDHMFVVEWTPERGWHDARVQPYGPFVLEPAAAVLHYAQEIFEGLKAFRAPDGSVWTFRADANARRMGASAQRMALPELPDELFLDSLRALVETDADWVPAGGETSLYLRPFMFASEAFLGVRPAKHVTYAVIASPAGAYFAGGVKPVSIWLSEDFSRAAPGGMGGAKTGGNYAGSMAAQAEGMANGCDQVAFLDAVTRSTVEELGGMNLFFVYDDVIATPELTGTFLEGITRASIIELARDLGFRVEERAVTIDEWRDNAADGSLREVFACGTAAVITPVGTLKWRGGAVTLDVSDDAVSLRIRERLLDIQMNRADDPHGWMRRLA